MMNSFNKEIIQRAIMPSDTKIKYVQNAIITSRSYFEERLTKISAFEDHLIKTSCCFTIIDSLAQEFYNYPAKNTGKAFIDFVLKFQNHCNYIVSAQ